MTQQYQDLNAGLVANVGALRDQYQADLVQLIIESGEYCGFGNVMQSATTAFAVSSTTILMDDKLVRLLAVCLFEEISVLAVIISYEVKNSLFVHKLLCIDVNMLTQTMSSILY
jgi:hypothetical protein